MYTSTRDNSVRVSAAQAIANGISKDGGLFVPTQIPTLTADELKELVGMDYQGRAVAVLSKYLSDFTEQEVQQCCFAASVSADKAKLPVGIELDADIFENSIVTAGIRKRQIFDFD